MDNLNVFKHFAPQVINIFNNSKDAVTYTRVSDSKQEDNTSLGTQLSGNEAFAKTNGFNIVAYFGGTHESAKSDDDRKEFSRMIAFVKRNKNVRYIIVSSYERFSRTGADGMKIAQDLQRKYNVITLSASQGIDPTTISGEFQRNIFLLFGHFENQMRKEKTVSGMRDLIEKGYTPYSIPRGYVNLNKGKAVEQKIILNDEGKLLRKAFIWKAEKQMRNCEILQRLKALGVKMDDRRLCEILANPYYCGIIVSKLIPNKVVEGRHEPMISREIFLKANNIIADNRYQPVSHKAEDENLPLKRFSRCSECNTPLTGFVVRKKNLWYYKCRTKGCSTSKNAKQLHDNFKTLISAYEINEEQTELIKLGITVMYSAFFEEVNENEKLYNAKVSELKKKIETAEENLVTGVIDRSMFDKFNSKFNSEIAEVERLLTQIKNGSSNLEKCLNKVVEYCKKPLLWWESASVGEKMMFQNMLFPNGVIYNRKSDEFQTPRVNSYFQPIPQLAGELRGKKNGDSVNFDAIPARVTSSGVKPETFRAVI